MDDRRQTGPRNWLRWALALSLALNLLIVGALAGAAYRFAGGPGARDDAGPGLRSYATPYVVALPRDARRALGRALRRDDAAAPPSRADRRALYQQMLGALRADPFDRAAAEAVLSAQQEAVQSVQVAAHAAWLEQVAMMDQAERAAYALRLEEVLRRGNRRDRTRRD